MLCLIVQGPTLDEAESQLKKAASLADVIELRLDLIEGLDFTRVEKLRKSSSKPMIFTLRPPEQGGKFSKGEMERLDLLKKFAALEPNYIDFEYFLSEGQIKNVLEGHPSIIPLISYHDFSATPDNMGEIWSKLPQIEGAHYKIATTAKSSLDVLRLFQYEKSSSKPISMMAMGKIGQPTRIAGPLFKSELTYASLDDCEVAPGQLSASALLNTYQYKSLNEETKLLGLIGDPVDKSIGYLVHNEIFRENKINALYVNFLIKDSELGAFLTESHHLGLFGFSVTMPHKERIIPFLNEIDNEAKEIGAVNTLSWTANGWKGFNTDGKGALNAIEEVIYVFGKKVLLLGAGGASKAIAYEAQKRGAEVIILNRDAGKAKILAEQIQGIGGGLEEFKKFRDQGYDILINCTPEGLPIDPELFLAKSVVMDINTKPSNNQFLSKAAEKNCRTIEGYRMFMHQAMLQLEIWFNKKFAKEF